MGKSFGFSLPAKKNYTLCNLIFFSIAKIIEIIARYFLYNQTVATAVGNNHANNAFKESALT